MDNRVIYYNSLIHSFIHAISIAPLQVPYYSRHSTDAVLEFHAEAKQAIVSEGLARGLYVAIRVGFEPKTLWTKGDEPSNEPTCPNAAVFNRWYAYHGWYARCR